jgi:hypothetical protein
MNNERMGESLASCLDESFADSTIGARAAAALSARVGKGAAQRYKCALTTESFRMDAAHQ